MHDAPTRPRTWLNGLLFILTVLTTCYAGLLWSANFLFFESGAAADPVSTSARGLSDPLLFPLSALYAAALMAILVGHEMGHYLTCRRYGVEATLPYFLPGLPYLGTFGAFIRIKSPRRKRQLFDIGANGPFAGFVLALAALVAGLAFSRLAPFTPSEGSISFGEPLLFKLLTSLFFGRVPEGQALVLHPVGFAAWGGLLVTSLNLLPISQLDGGHIAYAVLGRRARTVSRALMAVLAVMGVFFYTGWLVFGALILFFDLKFKLRLRHPPVEDEDQPLDMGRRVRAVLIVLIFVLSFIPDPVKGYGLIGILKDWLGG
jgi:membrane-associated protease RseP (regulator of RpoE activity)